MSRMLTYNVLFSPTRLGTVMVNHGIIIVTDHATGFLHGFPLMTLLMLCEQRGWHWEQVRQ